MTIDQRFKEQVQRHPDQRALTFGGKSLTYAELDRRIDVLARRLVCAGVHAGDIVAIRLEPRLEMVIAMFGVLRAGATYLPIDTALPDERTRYLLDDSGANITIRADFFDGIDVDAPLPSVSANDGAYLIYTSGTTGHPKGVLVEHDSVVNYVDWFRTEYGIDASHTAALLTSYAYDLGYTALFTTLLSGGHLHLLPRSTCEDPAAIAHYLREQHVTFIKVTPSLLGALASYLDRDLRLIVTGGEKIRPRDVEAIYARCPEVLIVNHYGPTETTIGVMTHPIHRAQLEAFAKRPVIGKPIGNVRAYVVSDGALAPSGELWIGGRAVARGYHRREALTREKFIPDPFSGSGTVYRTGDLVRWTEEGTLEFLGRIDRQVKIRGYRVEPAEIEQVIHRVLGIGEVVVVERIMGQSNQLCAYYVGESRDPSQMRASLGQILPDHMVPAYFVRLPSLPRTTNGKLDVESLPEPSFAPASDQPKSETEEILLEMWSGVLGIDVASLAVTHNFFELGGHSLLMIQLIAEIDHRFQRTVPITAFYGEGTIRALARIIDS